MRKTEEIRVKMGAMALQVIEKTMNRVEKETILSNKTLKMISLSEKLYTTIITWGL